MGEETYPCPGCDDAKAIWYVFAVFSPDTKEIEFIMQCEFCSTELSIKVSEGKMTILDWEEL